MTLAAPKDSQAVRLLQDGVMRLMQRLEWDFGRTRAPAEGTMAHQFLLDALDRGEYRAMTVWPTVAEPRGVCYVGAGGLVVPAGLPDAAEPLASAVRGSNWRVLVGDLTLGEVIVDQAGSGLFRRRPYAREQRLMAADGPVAAPQPVALRRADTADIDRLTEFACDLHVEDEMGPPLSRGGRASVQRRVCNSVRRGASWVVDLDGQVVAKIDVSIESRRRGAQLAGVFVDRDRRGEGVARRAIAQLTNQLFDAGLPCVTLHVRADNVPALRAYEAAGFERRRRWLLALR